MPPLPLALALLPSLFPPGAVAARRRFLPAAAEPAAAEPAAAEPAAAAVRTLSTVVWAAACRRRRKWRVRQGDEATNQSMCHRYWYRYQGRCASGWRWLPAFRQHTHLLPCATAGQGRCQKHQMPDWDPDAGGGSHYLCRIAGWAAGCGNGDRRMSREWFQDGVVRCSANKDAESVPVLLPVLHQNPRTPAHC